MSEYLLVPLAVAAAGTAYAVGRQRKKAKERLRKEINQIPKENRFQYFESQLGRVKEIEKDFPSIAIIESQRESIISLISSPTISLLRSLSKEYLTKEDYGKFSQRLQTF
jgi:hypothetical protein